MELHRKHKGKLETKSKIKLDSAEVLALAYTPGVAEVSRQIAKNPSLARDYTMKRNSVAIVTDGSSILGLGNLGPLAALPVMEGKAAIFKEFADVDAIPICLDTQDTEEIIRAVKQIAPAFGGINLEDIAAPKCFDIEERLRKALDIPVVHDDQWGAATAVLAGLINSLKLTKLDKSQAKVVLSGCGAAGVATARLLMEYGIRYITFCDSCGIVTPDRPDLPLYKSKLIDASSATPKPGNLADAIKGSDVFIGLSKPNLLTPEMIETMAPNPIVFALANPDPEIMPDKAREAGAGIVATGRSDYPNQVNNSLVFPGLFRGALDAGIFKFNQKMFIGIAQALAECVVDLSPNKILPTVFEPNVVTAVAEAVKRYK